MSDAGSHHPRSAATATTRTDAPMSLSTQRALFGARPRYRGVAHRWAFFGSIPAGIVLVALSSTRTEVLHTTVFALATTFMFGASALVHLRRWSAARYETLFRLDHSAIFTMIAASTGALAAIGMHGTPGRVLLIVTWVLAVVGVVQEWMPFHPPRGLVNAIFLAVAWVPIVLLPAMWDQLGPTIVGLILAEGVVYSSGAIIVGSQKPDPSPEVFGYHEVWHVLVIVGAAIHYAILVLLVT